MKVLDRVASDWTLAAGLVLFAQFELWVTHAYGEPTPATFAVVVAGTVPLFWRRRHPLPVVAAVMLALLAGALFDASGNDAFSLPIAVAVAVYGAGAYAGEAGAAATGATLITGGWVWTLFNPDVDGVDFGDLFFVAFVVLVPLLAGVAMRRRRLREDRLEKLAVRLDRERDELAQHAVTAERARIARELHDVVAHAISVIVLQARGGRSALADSPADAREAFDSIDATARQALAEMRRLLGLLRDTGDEAALGPMPGVASLGGLVSHMRQAGLPVEFSVEGEPTELPPGVDLSAYRIVQEGLTNALRHSGPALTHVVLTYGDREFGVRVTDDGRGVAGDNGSGYGLAGIRERVAIYGGQLEVGPGESGGFTLHARLPLGAQ
jgi:signal transduction histidine kinase